MAVRPSVSLTVALVFFLLGVAIARVPSSLHENEVSFPNSLPVSDDQSALRLPSDSGSNDESHHSYPDPNAQGEDVPGLQSPETMTPGSAPVTYLRFHDLRPINRRFPFRSRYPFRHCRHHHLRHGHPFFRPVRRNADIPHGNGMISSSGEDEWVRDLDLVRWVRLPYRCHHHHHDDDEDGLSKFALKHGHRFGRERFDERFDKHRYHNDRQGNEEAENEEKRDKEERKEPENGEKAEGGFSRRIRKFLGHF